MTYSARPAIAGVELPRPSSVSESPEPVRSTVTLAGGSTRVYDNGVRDVFELSWNKLTEADLVALRAAARPPFVAYRHVDGETYTVETSPPSASPIAGTDPVRFAVSITLRGQTPS